MRRDVLCDLSVADEVCFGTFGLAFPAVVLSFKTAHLIPLPLCHREHFAVLLGLCLLLFFTASYGVHNGLESAEESPVFSTL